MAFCCPYCNGPVPYNEETPTDKPLACMQCEQLYEHSSLAKTILSKFGRTQTILWLIQASNVTTNDKYLKMASTQMDILCGYIYPFNAQWLQMVADLCMIYYEQKDYSKTVEWLQWLVDRFELFLGSAKHLDKLEQLHQTNLWTSAYTEFLAKKMINSKNNSLTRYVKTGEQMFLQRFTLLGQIYQERNFEHLVADKSAVLKTLHREAVQKWRRFVEISGSEMVITEAIDETLYDIEDDLEFLATD